MSELLWVYIILQVMGSAATYGMTLGFFWRKFPRIQSAETFREHRKFALGFAIADLIFPFILFIVYFLSDFAKHGLVFRMPTSLR